MGHREDVDQLMSIEMQDIPQTRALGLSGCVPHLWGEPDIELE